MTRIVKVLAITALLIGTTAATEVLAADRVLLGDRHVTDRSERDTISVGTSRGKFKSLQVKVTGAAVEFKRVVVHFENGSDQVFEKNRVIRKGDRSHKIDLEGGSRFIDKVVFHYEARSRGWKGAEIKLWGIR